MSNSFIISVTFLDDRFHGRAEAGAAEWPPSPLRLFQAVVASNGASLALDHPIGRALRWLERQPPPEIWAPTHHVGQAVPTFVPNNAMDIPAAAWARGDNSFSGSADPALHRTKKVVRPTHLRGGSTVHYLWSAAPDSEIREPLAEGVGQLTALGWGIDLAVAQARFLSASCEGYKTDAPHRWLPDGAGLHNPLRLPVQGTLEALMDRHDRFLRRLEGGSFTPSPPLTRFQTMVYRRADTPPPRPYQAFELRRADGSFFAYPARKLIHLAGQVRHAALAVTQDHLPPDATADWRERFVAGHRDQASATHRQLSYLPLPSIGHRHTDPSVRRFLLAADREAEADLRFVARRLAGQYLTPEHRSADPKRDAVLVPLRSDPVLDRYLKASTRWASVTPVILPGHNDRRRTKTYKLVAAALRHAGVTSPCEFTVSEVSRFPKSYSAARPQKGGGAPAYFRPDHLQHLPAVHLEIEFKDAIEVPGPLSIGAGRHQGLGLMARID